MTCNFLSSFQVGEKGLGGYVSGECQGAIVYITSGVYLLMLHFSMVVWIEVSSDKNFNLKSDKKLLEDDSDFGQLHSIVEKAW